MSEFLAWIFANRSTALLAVLAIIAANTFLLFSIMRKRDSKSIVSKTLGLSERFDRFVPGVSLMIAIAALVISLLAWRAAPNPPGLQYVASTFTTDNSGIRGRVSFRANGNVALGAVEFLVSVVGTEEARIESINPAASVSLMVQTVISQDRRQARVRYTPTSADPPGFTIKLSAPTKLRIEGSPGVRAFEIEAVAGRA